MEMHGISAPTAQIGRHPAMNHHPADPPAANSATNARQRGEMASANSIIESKSEKEEALWQIIGADERRVPILGTIVPTAQTGLSRTMMLSTPSRVRENSVTNVWLRRKTGTVNNSGLKLERCLIAHEI